VPVPTLKQEDIVKVVGYVRVSTEEQAREGISLDMQKAKIQAYASFEDLVLLEVISDEGISGCTIKARPGIQRVLEMVRCKEVGAVIIYKLDRLARNTIEALEIAKLMDGRGIGLHSITERLDTKSAMGRFFFTLMASIAEMERGIISERISAAMERKREKGEARNNNPPYGFLITGGKLVPQQREQAAISRMHELRGCGCTIYAISEALAAEGFFNRKSRPFGKTQVHNILARYGRNVARNGVFVR
jgi:site-specific DNA recombinase